MEEGEVDDAMTRKLAIAEWARSWRFGSRETDDDSAMIRDKKVMEIVAVRSSLCALDGEIL
jgi:hypothetical protein